MSETNKAFGVQRKVRGPWRRYLDTLAPLRPALHRYCCKLTGNLWDGEDLVQDTLMKVFSLLGRIDAKLDNPQAYLVRTATNLWIDRMRRAAREHALLELQSVEEEPHHSAQPEALELRDASRELLRSLHPQERAAIVLKEVFDYSLDECASILKTSTGAVKSALHRARGRVNDNLPRPAFGLPGREIVEQFMRAIADKDLDLLEQICATDLNVELVGGAELHSFEHSKVFFRHAHGVMPILGFGANPHWAVIEFEGEPMVVGYRTLHGVEGVNEVHRLEVLDNKITRVRAYCFSPDVLDTVAKELGKPVIRRPILYRSPSLPDIPGLVFKHFFSGKTSRLELA